MRFGKGAERDRDAGQGSLRSQWAAVLLAAAPHLIMGFMTVLPELAPTLNASWFSYGVLVTVVGTMLIAWQQGWPLWSASWAGYALLAAFFLSSSALSPWPFTFGLGDVLLLLSLILFGMFMFQRRPLYGLLGSLPFLVLWERFFAFELVLGGPWIFAGLWLLTALVTGAIVWFRSMRHAIYLTVGFHLISGVAVALGRGYLPYRWPELHVWQAPTWQELVNDFLPLTLALVALMLA